MPSDQHVHCACVARAQCTHVPAHAAHTPIEGVRSARTQLQGIAWHPQSTPTPGCRRPNPHNPPRVRATAANLRCDLTAHLTAGQVEATKAQARATVTAACQYDQEAS